MNIPNQIQFVKDVFQDVIDDYDIEFLNNESIYTTDLIGNYYAINTDIPRVYGDIFLMYFLFNKTGDVDKFKSDLILDIKRLELNGGYTIDDDIGPWRLKLANWVYDEYVTYTLIIHYPI